jgi:hypothetical protein
LGALGFLIRFLRFGRALQGGAQLHVILERDANRLQADTRLIELRVYLLEAVKSEGGAHRVIIKQKPGFFEKPGF